MDCVKYASKESNGYKMEDYINQRLGLTHEHLFRLVGDDDVFLNGTKGSVI
jgi:hypothetical protein